MLNLRIFFYKFFNSIFLFKIKTTDLIFSFGLCFYKKNNYYLKGIVAKYFNNYLKNIKVASLISNISFLSFFESGLKIKKRLAYKYNLSKSLIVLINVDDDVFLNEMFISWVNNYIVYFGSFFDNGAKISNFIIPVSFFLNIMVYF